MKNWKSYAVLAMAAFYILAGINHFLNPAMYIHIMPPWIPMHELMVQLSGVAEILLGLAFCYPKTRHLAAWGIVALLIAIFPAHVYMYQARDTVFTDIPAWILLSRMPFQLVLIWIAIYLGATTTRKPS